MKIFYDENGKRGNELNIQNLSEMTTFKNGNGIFAFNGILTEWSTDLSSLTNGSQMFYNSALESFDSDLSSLTDGYQMFDGCKLDTASVQNIASTINNLSDDTDDGSDGWGQIHIGIGNSTPNSAESSAFNTIANKGWTVYVNGSLFSPINIDLYKYNTYTTISDLTADYPDYKNDITNGEWNYYLDNLTDGGSMFWKCGALTTFNPDLSNLTVGGSMFGNCSNLKSFDSDLKNLTDGSLMFGNCSSLTSFTSDLPKLTDGRQMFVYTALKSFNGDLSSLTDGYQMFDGCELDTTSVQNIASTINDLSDDTNDGSDGWGQIHIGIGNSTPNSTESSAFNTIASKGWTVFVNGSPFSPIIDLYKYNTYTNIYVLAADYPDYINDITTNGEWNYYLDNLTDGYEMFQDCSSLTTFNPDLSSLTDGFCMFYNSALTTFSSMSCP